MAVATPPAHGTVDATPWARAAVGDATALRRLRERIPAGHTLSLSGRSARGPWQVRVILPGGHEARTRYEHRDIAEAIAAVLEAIGAGR